MEQYLASHPKFVKVQAPRRVEQVVNGRSEPERVRTRSCGWSQLIPEFSGWQVYQWMHDADYIRLHDICERDHPIGKEAIPGEPKTKFSSHHEEKVDIPR